MPIRVQLVESQLTDGSRVYSVRVCDDIECLSERAAYRLIDDLESALNVASSESIEFVK